MTPVKYESVNLVEMFWTFQGEGQHAGRRALFVRLPFCNLACSWCDTQFNKFVPVTRAQFEEEAGAESARYAVVTGGEPLMNKHFPTVVAWLKAMGFEVAVETNGTVPMPELEEPVDFVTCSPKRFAADKGLPAFFIHPGVLLFVSEFKYVVEEGFDFSVLPSTKDHPGVRYSLSPEWENFKASMGLIEGYIRENPRWKVSLQTHKFMCFR